MADGEFAFLRDGGQVLLRPARPEDRIKIRELLQGLSPESRALRFHSAGARIDDDTLDRATAGHVLVAELQGEIVGLASYVRLRDPGRAEMAIAVADAQQGRGIGTALFEKLSREARSESES